MQRHQLVLDFQRRGIVPRKAERLHLAQQLGRDIRGDRDTANATLGVEPVRCGILARELDKIRPAQHPLVTDPRQIAGGILDTDDARQLGQLRHGFGQHINDRTAGDIVDDDRQTAGLVDRGEMRDQTGLGRLVVIGRDNQNRIGTDAFGVFGQTDAFGRVVRTGTCNDGDTPRGGFDDFGDNGFMLGMGQGGRFTGGPDRHQPVRSFRDVPFHQLLERVQIQRAVRERRDECR